MCTRLIVVAAMMYAAVEIIYNYDAIMEIVNELNTNDSSPSQKNDCQIRDTRRRGGSGGERY